MAANYFISLDFESSDLKGRQSNKIYVFKLFLAVAPILKTKSDKVCSNTQDKCRWSFFKVIAAQW